MAFQSFSRNGEIRSIAEAVMPLSSIEYAYGFGVYETVRIVRGVPFFLDAHLDRLLRSAALLALDHPFDRERIADWLHTLVRTVGTEAFNVKILLIGARRADDAQLFLLPLAPLFPDKRLYRDGARAMTEHYERLLPHAKTLNMLPSYLAYRRAKAAGCFDALFVNPRGCITEGTRTNFFALRGRTIVSPPTEEILEGVTLVNVLRIAREHGFSVTHEPIPLAEIGRYDGAFLTSATSKIVPLAAVDGAALKIPDPLRDLLRHFDAFLDSIAPPA